MQTAVLCLANTAELTDIHCVWPPETSGQQDQLLPPAPLLQRPRSGPRFPVCSVPRSNSEAAAYPVKAGCGQQAQASFLFEKRADTDSAF